MWTTVKEAREQKSSPLFQIHARLALEIKSKKGKKEMKRTFNILVLVTLLALAFGAAVAPAKAAPAPAPMFAPPTVTLVGSCPGTYAMDDGIINLGVTGVWLGSSSADVCTFHLSSGVDSGDITFWWWATNPPYDIWTLDFNGSNVLNDGGLDVPMHSQTFAAGTSVTDLTISHNNGGSGTVFTFCLAGVGLFDVATMNFVASTCTSTPSDTTPPVVTVPSDITAEATSSSGAVVTFSVSATDETSPANPAVTCDWPSGSTFPLGTTNVDCSATDDAGNTGHGYFNVTVQDTTAPDYTFSTSNPYEATGPGGANAGYNVSFYDTGSGMASQGCTPASGSLFPIGSTQVDCSGTDNASNTKNMSLYINVVDTTAPTLNLPANITVPQVIPAGAFVIYVVTATDAVDASPTVVCTPASGSVFPLGTTTVNCSATDNYANTSYGSFDVTVTASGNNLLKKPSFDNATVFPTPWKAFGFRPPYIKALDCTVFNFAPCSVLFPAGNRAAYQQVNLVGHAGDTYSFGMYSAANNGGGTYRVELLFYNNFNKLLGSNYLDFNAGTHDFELVNGSATAPVNYNKIIFRFVYQNSTGRAWFDDAFLYFLGNVE